MLHDTYEKMIIAAMLDPAFAAQLLANPRQAALDAGLSALVAESLVGLHAPNLSDFCAALHRRLHGTAPTRTAPLYPATRAEGYTAAQRMGTAS